MHSHLSISQKHPSSLIRRAAIASVTVAIFLISLKFFAWWHTGAVSLKATLIDSLLDGLASLINLLAVWQAHQPANKQFQFGYGKAEAISAFAQAMFIAGSACFLTFEATQRFVYPEPILAPDLGIIMLIIVMILTLFLISYQRFVIKQTGSAAIRADSLHYRSDLLINMGVLASLYASRYYGILWLDAISGILIGLYILYTAWDIAREGFHILMDRELPEEEREKIIALAYSHPHVKGLHELRTRSSGMKKFIQLHLELDGDIPLRQAHLIADEVEKIILAVFTDAEVLIHQDPVGLREHHLGNC